MVRAGVAAPSRRPESQLDEWTFLTDLAGHAGELADRRLTGLDGRIGVSTAALDDGPRHSLGLGRHRAVLPVRLRLDKTKRHATNPHGVSPADAAALDRGQLIATGLGSIVNGSSTTAMRSSSDIS